MSNFPKPMIEKQPAFIVAGPLEPVAPVFVAASSPMQAMRAARAARAQAVIAATQARHTQGAAYVKANAARLQAFVASDAGKAALALQDPPALRLQTKLTKANADA